MNISRYKSSELQNSLNEQAPAVSEVLAFFAKSLNKPGNYLTMARSYMKYCIARKMAIGDISFNLHTDGFNKYRKSTLRRFLRFCMENRIYRVVSDPSSYELPPAANELILGFIRQADTLRGDHSRKTYIYSLNAFFAYLDGNSQSFNRESVGMFVSDLLREQKSPFTVNLYLSVIKQMADWIVDNRNNFSHKFTQQQIELLLEVKRVKPVKVERGYHKDALSEEEREILQRHIKGAKWKTVCSLMAYGGLRMVEVTRLRLMDVDLESRRLSVKGKGKYSYVDIKLPTNCLPYLQAWMEEREVMPGTGQERTSYLFPGDLGPMLKTDQIRYQIKKAMKEAGLARDKLSTHSLRHTAAQLLIDKNVEAVYVQRHLRHSSMETTQNYINKKLDEKYFDRLPDDF